MINVPLAVAKGNFEVINPTTIKVWEKTTVISCSTATKSDVEAGKAHSVGMFYDYRTTETIKEEIVQKPNWFGKITVTTKSLRKLACSDVKSRHGINAQKHPVFQGKYAAGLPMVSEEKLVNKYLVLTYSNSANYENGVKSSAEFEGLELFFELVSQFKDVKILAAHSFAALLYSEHGYQSPNFNAVLDWCHQYAGEEGFSFALID